MTSRPTRSRRDDSGFTLVELLVVVILMGVFGALVSTTIIRSMQVQRHTSNRAFSDTMLTDAVDAITKEIRGASPVISRSSNSLTVEDYHSGKRFRYTWSYDSTTHVLSQTTSAYATATAATPTTTVTKPMVSPVTNASTAPVFAFYHRDGSVVASAETNGAVARVDLQLQVTPSEAKQPVTVNTSIFLRNYAQS